MNTPKPLSFLKLKTLLTPMGNVVSTIRDDSILFEKDDIVFCKINNDKIYLMDDIHAFKQVKSRILKNPDKFLQEATKAYWIAAGNHIQN